MMLGVRADGAYVSASRSRRIGRGGMALDVRMPHHLTFLADGDRHEVTTTATDACAARWPRPASSCARRTGSSADLSAVPYAEQVVGRHPGRRQARRRGAADQFETVEAQERATSTRATTKVVEAGQGRHRGAHLPRDLPRRQARLPQAGRASGSPRSR